MKSVFTSLCLYQLALMFFSVARTVRYVGENRIEYRYSRGSRDSWWDSIHLPTVRWYLFLLQLRIIYSTYILSWFNHIALYFFCTHAVWHYDKYNDVYTISSYTVWYSCIPCILNKWIQMDITMRFQPSFFYPFTLSIK